MSQVGVYDHAHPPLVPDRALRKFRVYRRTVPYDPNPQQHVQPCLEKSKIDFVQELIARVNVRVWHPQRVGPLRAGAIIRLKADVGKFLLWRRFER